MNSEASLAARYDEIQMRAFKAPGAVPMLIAVSKMQPISAIEELYRLGHRDFGENYVQELVRKAVEMADRGCSGIRWHMIGHLQTNKVKLLIPHVYCVHTVDSERLALELAKRWKSSSRPGRLPVFIEVNIDDEVGKSGARPGSTAELAAKVAAIPDLDLQGLMCIPDPEHQDSETHPFHLLRKLELTCRPWSKGGLSMGMSDDFEKAIRAGATHIRVGTALFGSRP
ncbi:MAG: YggS family pyridoxal phosphate enzyme [Bdellovibrionales bacterium RIFOXYC1_FULL_54_43]|nr:MAG: YggS family pyridoxal phosphate enzyme [Bdellovibrionales bacterium RIFOXYC1_FULL_54_43]OFZ82270.1 MAG: YggS family pyridoxal phosphate enzyme [Bdellovibrionales bacterium RIFOXYD1_FULL_55_31]